MKITASFRDASGRIVATDALPEIVLPRSSAGWIGGEVDGRGLVPPAAVYVTATGVPFPFRQVPFQVDEVRATFDPGPAGGFPSLAASARVRNPNRTRLGLGRLYSVAFDPAGALLSAKSELIFLGFLPGDILAVRSAFFADETAPGARVEWFPAIRLGGAPTRDEGID